MIHKSLGTHNGHFHADEITACALLILYERINKELIFRTRDEDVLSKCEYVCDVGGVYDPSKKRFDHHQADYKGSLSSAGMILSYLKDEQVITNELCEFLNNYFVKGVDAHDTGNIKLQIGYCSFSQVIESFVPLNEEMEDALVDRSFFEALEFVLNFLRRLIKRFYYFMEVKKIVQKHMEKKDLFLIFNKAISWLESFFELGGRDHPALFIVMPSGKHWKLRAIPPSYEDRMNVRVPLPETWAGLRDERLETVSGIKGAIFCHKGRFISIWETKEAAIKACQEVLKKERLL